MSLSPQTWRLRVFFAPTPRRNAVCRGRPVRLRSPPNQTANVAAPPAAARQRDLIGSPRNDRSQCNNPLDTTPTPSMAKPSYQSVALGGLAEHPPAHSAKPCTATTKPTAADATSHAMPTKIVGHLLLACANEHSQLKRKYTLYPAAIVIRKLAAYRSAGVYWDANKDSKSPAIASKQTMALV
jgi:hypothetical protein